MDFVAKYDVRNFCGFLIDMPGGGIESATASVDVGVVSVAMERWNSTLCWRLCRKSILTGPSGLFNSRLHKLISDASP